jgi:hypothetical protein
VTPEPSYEQVYVMAAEHDACDAGPVEVFVDPCSGAVTDSVAAHGAPKTWALWVAAVLFGIPGLLMWRDFHAKRK